MKQSIRNKLDRLLDRLGELDRELLKPNAVLDMNRYRELTRERAEIEPITVLVRALQQTEPGNSSAASSTC